MGCDTSSCPRMAVTAEMQVSLGQVGGQGLGGRRGSVGSSQGCLAQLTWLSERRRPVRPTHGFLRLSLGRNVKYITCNFTTS